MATPVVEGRAESAQTTAGTSHPVTLPAGIAAGDLIVIFFGHSLNPSLNALAGWTELVDNAVVNGEKWIVRTADGTEGTSVTFTTSSNTRSAHLSWRISGAEDIATQLPELSTVATGTSTTPDPSTCTPTGGAKDYLWITGFVQAGEEADDDTWCTAAPTNYANLVQKTCGIAGVPSNNCSVAAADRALNAASENPGTFTVAQSLGYRAWTLAIHPTAAGGPQTVDGVVLFVTPTLPVGRLDHTVMGVALSTIPSLPAGRLDHTLTGIALSTAPSLPVGTVQTGQIVDGVVLSTTPSLPAGRLDHTLTGVALSTTPSLPTGNVFRTVEGVVLTATPSLPAGQIDHTLTGIVLSTTPTLPAGSITSGQAVDGIVLSVTPTLPAGQINLSLTGMVLSTTPTLPAGNVGPGVSGVALSITPTLPAGSIAQTLTGIALSAFPDLPVGSVVYPQSLTGIVLSIIPTLPSGSVSHEVLVSAFYEVSDNQTCMDPTHNHRTATNRIFRDKGPRGRTIRRGI